MHFKGFFGRQNGRFYGRFDSRIAAAIADGVSSCESARETSGACAIGFLGDYFSTPESWSVQTWSRRSFGHRPAHAPLAAAHPGHDPGIPLFLLTSAGRRAMLETAHTVIVDEVHAVAVTKRGAHLALSLARLDALAGQGLRRIGLSATQRPIDEVARYLCGEGPCHIVDMGHRRAWDLGLVLPPSPLAAVMSNEVWGEVYDRLADLIARHRTTIVFVNTRRMAERVARKRSINPTYLFRAVSA